MLHCDLCNYFEGTQTIGQMKSKCMCQLTGFVFHKKPEDYDMENHPCYDYEVKRKPLAEVQFEGIQITERKLA